MTETPGIDTIRGLVGTPPKRITVSYDMVRTGEKLRQVWNAKFIAFIPYCFACKEPLVWHTNPGNSETLFHCPKCRREWVKDKDWIAREESK